MMQEEIDNRYDVVVVGSGHNGLVAACYLAQAGKRVLVLEKNTSFGGATASHRIFPDYDAMLSRYSYLVSLLPHKIVRELGLSFQTRRRKTASFTPWQDGNGRQQGLVLSNVDESRSRESMFAMTGSHSAWDRYQEFLSLQAAIAKVVWPTVLEPMRSRQTFESNLKSAVEREAWNRFVERPLGEAIEHFVDHDALRGLLLTDGKIGVFTHAHDESLLQNRCFLYHVIGNETGEWCVPVGGMHSLVRSLLERCRALGVHLVSQAAVTNVSAGAGRHEVGFSKEGQERSVYGQNVLVNAGPRTFARIFGLPWEASSANEGSVVKINMLLRRLPKLKAQGISAQEAFAGSFHIDEGYQQMAASYATAARGELPAPVPGEVYCHTLTDNSILSQDLNQQGYHTLTLFGLDMPWRLFASDHDKRKQQVAELYLRGLNNLTEESFEDCLALDSSGQPCIEVKTPQDLQSEIDLDQGNIFHSELSWFFCDDAAGSWGVETSIPGVFRAGSSALRGGAVSGIPGHNAAMCVLKNG